MSVIFRPQQICADLLHRLLISIKCSQFYCGAASRCSAAVEERDLYQILGVESSASTKEIKAAYYQLSKIYHPDRHEFENKKQLATEKFLQVAEAYEVLSSDEKRKAYDNKYQKRNIQTSTGSWPTRSIRVKKNFEDLGLDYKTFEEFQRSVNNRRRMQHHHWQMPNEYFAHFGSHRKFADTFRPRTTSYFTYSYKDPMQRQREMKEWLILKEIEEEKLKSKYKIPTFAAMEKERLSRERREKMKSNILLLVSGCLLVFFYKHNA
ncbi:unnamed protein product [Thelazia callipaeda]|uniref:J domain-containing protein n=1 Tax=Thelazia callipaeda TaxID=103827 RepID=A0A0N5CX97_THECL|nr:unnamed protein product [Thelazia callipaeda]